LTQGVIWKQIFLFAVPLIIGNLFQQLYNIVDSIIIGNFLGGLALAAVGAGSTFMNIMLGIFIGLATGAGVVIAQFFGAGDDWGVRESVSTASAFTLVAGIAISAFGILICAEILQLLNTPKEVFPDAHRYMRIYFGGMFPILVYNMGAAILRAVGDSKTPLYILLIASVLHALIDLIFVAMLGLGVASVAVSTVLSESVAAVMVMAKLMRTREVYRLDLTKMRFNLRILRRMTLVAVPTAMQQVVMGISNLAVQSRINALGTSVMAAWNVFGRIDGIVVQTLVSFGLAMTTFTGQNVGARALDRVYRGAWTGVKMNCAFAVSLSAVIYIWGRSITGFFTNDPEIIAYCVQMIRWLIPFYVTVAVMYALIGVINGAGYSLATMLIMLFCLCVLRITFLQFMSSLLPGLYIIFGTYIVSWSCCSLGLWAYYKKGAWRKNLIDFGEHKADSAAI
jgi:putative MATE family efflux protein